MREAFRTKLAELAANQEARTSAWLAGDELNKAVDAWYKADNRRKKRAGLQPLALPQNAEQIADAPLRERALHLLRAYSDREQAHREIVAALDAAAQQILPLAGSLQIVLSRVYAGSYSTQGYGASRYAQAAAEATADAARVSNVPVDVVLACELWEGCSEHYATRRGVLDVHGNRCSVSTAEAWHVVVYVADPIDAEILRRRPGPPLVESVRLCWARGVNPRVFFPGLSHDFESLHGLDYHGGYKASARIYH